jgi:hypothetical protein
MQSATVNVTPGLRLHVHSLRWTPGRILMWTLCLTPSMGFAIFGAFVLRALYWLTSSSMLLSGRSSVVVVKSVQHRDSQLGPAPTPPPELFPLR